MQFKEFRFSVYIRYLFVARNVLAIKVTHVFVGFVGVARGYAAHFVVRGGGEVVVVVGDGGGFVCRGVREVFVKAGVVVVGGGGDRGVRVGGRDGFVGIVVEVVFGRVVVVVVVVRVVVGARIRLFVKVVDGL